MRLKRSMLSLSLVLGISLSAPGQHSTPAASLLRKGLVVENVSKNSIAQHLGIHPGDLLLSWERAGVTGEFDSPFDLASVFLDQAPRGPITISAVRGRERLKWILGSD